LISFFGTTMLRKWTLDALLRRSSSASPPIARAT
jgi:hypothetical protein